MLQSDRPLVDSYVLKGLYIRLRLLSLSSSSTSFFSIHSSHTSLPILIILFPTPVISFYISSYCVMGFDYCCLIFSGT